MEKFPFPWINPLSALQNDVTVIMAAITSQTANASPVSTNANLSVLVVPHTTACFNQDSDAIKQDLLYRHTVCSFKPACLL